MCLHYDRRVGLESKGPAEPGQDVLAVVWMRNVVVRMLATCGVHPVNLVGGPNFSFAAIGEFVGFQLLRSERLLLS